MKKIGIIAIMSIILISVFILGGIVIAPEKNIEKSEANGKRQIVDNEKLSDFDKMSLEIGAANVQIIEGDTYSISIDVDEKIAIDYKVDNKNLEVIQKSNDDKVNKKHFENNGGNNIIITIPEDKKIKILKTEQGVGAWEVNDLFIEEIDMTMGVGSCNLNNIVNQNLKIEGGVGNFETQNIKAKDITVEAGVGNIDINGEIKGNIDIEGGLGRIALKTTLSEDQYYYELEKGLGGIIFNGKVIESEESFGDNKAPYTMTISSGVGSIEVETK